MSVTVWLEMREFLNYLEFNFITYESSQYTEIKFDNGDFEKCLIKNTKIEQQNA